MIKRNKFVILFLGIVLNGFVYGKIEQPKNVDNRTFVTIFLKDQNVFKGNGLLIEKRKSDGIIDKIILEDTVFSYDETDSIHLHFISGYPDSLGWAFQIIKGEISVVVYDIEPWLQYYNIYPVLELRGHPSSVTKEIVTKEFMFSGQTYYRTIWGHASRLKKTMKEILYKEKSYEYSDSLIKSIVSNKNTSLLYTEPFLYNNLHLLAILDYNFSGIHEQPYIDSLYDHLNTLKPRCAAYLRTYEKLKQAFVVYNSNNTDMLHQLYIDNVKVYKKNKAVKVGHGRISFGGNSDNWAPLGDTRKGSLQWRMQFSSNPYYKTVNIDQRSRTAMRYRGILLKLIIDGVDILPEETDSLLINGHIAYPDPAEEQWKFKE